MSSQTPPPGTKVVLEVLRVRVQRVDRFERSIYHLLQDIGFVRLRANPEIDRHVDASAPKQERSILLEYTVSQDPNTPRFCIRSLVQGAGLSEHRGSLSSLGQPKENGEVDLIGKDNGGLEWEFVCRLIPAES